MLILNRDVHESMVPSYSYEGIAKADSGEGEPSPYQRALSDLERFAASFDPHAFETETGKTLADPSEFHSIAEQIGPQGETTVDFSNLRWVLWMQVHDLGYPQYNIEKAKLVDRLLDAIHWEVSGTRRETVGCGPFEPWIGSHASAIGSSQLRFVLTTGPEFDRDRLFDFVAGLMLRRYGEELIPRSLGLYPPSYRIDESDLVDHTFMILIQPPGSGDGDVREQDAFAESVQGHASAAGLAVADADD